jgi:hypothetical protein
MITVLYEMRLKDPSEAIGKANDNGFPKGVNLVAALATSVYFLTFLVFIMCHTPRPVRMKGSNPEVWRSDRKSAYRPRIFFLTFVATTLNSVLTLVATAAIFSDVGWKDAPFFLRFSSILSPSAILFCFIDKVGNSSGHHHRGATLRFIVRLLTLFPGYTWFYTSFPLYSAARLSDLSWGNRPGGDSVSCSSEAKDRAVLARTISLSVIFCNAGTAALFISGLHIYGTIFIDVAVVTVVVLYSLLPIVNFVLNVSRGVKRLLCL